MAEPVRKMPADREPEFAPTSADPFRYGWRWRSVRLPSGEVVEQQIPLTPEDLLDPQLGDEVPQSDPHHELLLVVDELLTRRFASRQDVCVASDMKMLWGIPGFKEPSPDIAVIPGVRKKRDPERTVFDVVREGTRPCLVIEIVSSTDAETRRNDYERKVEIYQRAGIPEHLILDPATSFTQGRLLLTGYRLGPDGRYQRIEPDREGRLLSETAGLLFGVAEDGQTIRVFNAATGQRLLTPLELEKEIQKVTLERAAREAEARKVAEERAAAAEAELARLRAELERLGQS
ncbi:MAG TPA: Uma2 family endonuclease [Thermoanaerobaculia bacterium]|jgi:Uma2 family endonuclease